MTLTERLFDALYELREATEQYSRWSEYEREQAFEKANRVIAEAEEVLK